MTTEMVVDAVCSSYHDITGDPVTHEDVYGPSRIRAVIICRQAVQYILMEHYARTSVSVGKEMNRNHATVLHAVSTVRDRINTGQLEASVVAMALGRIPAATDGLIERASDGAMARLYRREKDRTAMLSRDLDKALGAVATLKREIADLKSEYVQMAKKSQYVKPINWTPEQLATLKEVRKRHIA